MASVKVIGAGLAGAEAAWQLAQRGIAVTLYEMKPHKKSPAHHTDTFAELVCSNSLRADGIANAVGLLKEELRREGFIVTTDISEVECIVMGFDTELTFQKLHDVSYMLLTRPDLPYIATNPDYVCPTEFGSVPDCGSVCDMIYNATKKRPVVIGKPSPLMPQLAMEKLGVSREETCVVGDRIYTDVKSGLNAGITGILVLSGETTREILDASEDKPHLVLEDASEILAAIK